jgi:subtilisin family serine protease
MRSFSIILTLLVLGVVASARLAPLFVADRPADRIQGSYVVVFDTSVSTAALHANADFIRLKTGQKMNVFTIKDFKAIGGLLPTEYVDYFRGLPTVQYIEEDQVSRASDCNTQTGAVWGINRVVQRTPINLDGNYIYDDDAGSNTLAYIVDTGILLTHVEFEGRAVWGSNFVGDNRDTDCNGHGTHVSGTVAGKTYGLSKKTSLIAVKVLGCSGSGSLNGFLSGIQFVTDGFTTNSTTKGKPSVANLSLAFGGQVASATQAVENSIAAGVNYAIAAGNAFNDACNYSPSDAPSANVVGATELQSLGGGSLGDRRASFSNYGTCVKLFAPGVNITSAWIGSNTATNTISGTSMASPHVGGAIALYISKNDPTPASVTSWLKSQTTNNVINLNCVNSACQQSPNALLYSPCPI